MSYLHARREALGGYLPRAAARREPLRGARSSRRSTSSLESTGEREISTTMALRAHAAARSLRDKEIGKRIVPIVARRGAHVRHGGHVPPARHLLARSASSTSPRTPTQLMFYQEDKDGQILQEGINEAGAMSSLDRGGHVATRRTACR